jgi:hypothetical protein
MSLAPSLVEVMLYKYQNSPGELSSVQVAPESVDNQIVPPEAPAASFVPSLEEVMQIQFCVTFTEVQVTPESVEVQMFPP